MYRHHQHLIDEENGNSAFKKTPKSPAKGSHENTSHANSTLSKTINSRVATVSKAMNPLNVNYRTEKDIPETKPTETRNDTHLNGSKAINSCVATVSKPMNPLNVNYIPDNVIPETKPAETRKDTHITEKVDEKKKTNVLKAKKIDLTKARRWPEIEASKTRTIGNYKWIFILSGLIVGIVSGFFTYTEVARSDKDDFVSLLESVSEEDAEAPDHNAYAYSKKEDTALVADKIIDKESDPEYPDAVIKTGVAEADENMAVIKDVDENPVIYAEDNMPIEITSNDTMANIDETNEPFSNDSNIADAEDGTTGIKETFIVSGNRTESDSRDKIELSPLKEDKALAMKQPLAQMKESRNVAVEKMILINEKPKGSEDQKPEVLIKKSDLKEAAALSLKKDKIDQLAQLLALNDIASNKKQIDLTGDAQSRNDNSVEEDKSYGQVVYVGPTLREQALAMKEPLETVGINRASLSKKLSEDNHKKNSTNDSPMNHPEIKEESVTASIKKQTIQAGFPALIVSNSEHHKPAEATIVADALTNKESIPSQNSHKNEQSDNAKKVEINSDKATQAINKEIIKNEGQRRSGPVLLAKNKISEPTINSPENFQPLKTVAMKEMSVTYEDQFNDHNNNWPEYNNDRASVLIEEGEYQVEHIAKSGSHIVLYPYGVPNDMNYMMQIAMSSVRGSGKNAYGIVFGGKDTDNNYSFRIHSDNSYSIKKRLGGHESELAGGYIDNVFISKGAVKTLKIVKLHGKLGFYVDDYYLDELSDVTFLGDKVGFLVEGKVKISVDSARTEIKYSSN